jgi:hypothetical protein
MRLITGPGFQAHGHAQLIWLKSLSPRGALSPALSFRQAVGNLEGAMDFSRLDDRELFAGVGEQDGSQAAYERNVEIQGRNFRFQREVLEAQLAAVVAQREATAEVRAQSKF